MHAVYTTLMNRVLIPINTQVIYDWIQSWIQHTSTVRYCTVIDPNDAVHSSPPYRKVISQFFFSDDGLKPAIQCSPFLSLSVAFAGYRVPLVISGIWDTKLSIPTAFVNKPMLYSCNRTGRINSKYKILTYRFKRPVKSIVYKIVLLSGWHNMVHIMTRLLRRRQKNNIIIYQRVIIYNAADTAGTR